MSTFRRIDWEKLETYKNESIEIAKVIKKEQENQKRIQELIVEKERLEQENQNMLAPYTNEWGRINKDLNNVAILSVFDSRNGARYEGRIISIDDNEILLYYFYGYGYSKQELKISTQELAERGFVKVEYMYIVNEMKNIEDVIDLITLILKGEKGVLINELNFANKQITEYQKSVKEKQTKLDEFETVKDSKVTQTFNKISFGLTELKAQDIVDNLPRKFKI